MCASTDIDTGLIAEAVTATGLPTKKAAVEKAAVEEALRQLMRRHQQRQAIADVSGLGWDGDLGAMREGRDA